MPKSDSPSTPGSALSAADIDIKRVTDAAGVETVQAHVHCARKKCDMDVEACARCPCFSRIEVHEAGYVLLCTLERGVPDADDADADAPNADDAE